MGGHRIQSPGHNRCNLALKFKISSVLFPTALGTGVNTEMRRDESPYLEHERPQILLHTRACASEQLLQSEQGAHTALTTESPSRKERPESVQRKGKTGKIPSGRRF
jgi:hypothetical protein